MRLGPAYGTRSDLVDLAAALPEQLAGFFLQRRECVLILLRVAGSIAVRA